MNVLLVQTSFLGDTILSTAVIAGIKKVFPDSKLWMMTTPLSTALVKRDPLLVDVIPFDKRKKSAGIGGLFKMAAHLQTFHFDMAFSLHRSTRTTILLGLSRIPVRIGCHDAGLKFLYHQTTRRDPRDHDVLRNLSILANHAAVDTLDQEMRLFAPEKDEIPPNILEKLPTPGTYAVVVPGSAWATKMWDWRGYHEVCRHLLSQGINVVLTGAPSDRAISAQTAQNLDCIDLTGQTSIDDTLYIIKHAKLVVCNDSMALHMASAFKIPNVAVFCATSPAFGYSPWRNSAIVVEKKGLPCKPCKPHGSRKCPNGTEACMKNLPAVEVIGAIDALLVE